MDWIETKIWLVQVTGLARDALHIYAALGIQFGIALFCRRALASQWPWLAVLLAVLVNEYLDYRGAGTDPQQIEFYRSESYHDIWNTMLMPSVLFFIAKFWPSWMIGRNVAMPETALGEPLESTV